jgi:CTP:molybdopterin cytidylyltransferase MocA
MRQDKVPILILAAGASRRMRGRDKLCEDVGGQPLLALQIARARAVGPTFVAVPSLSHPRADIVASTDAQPILAKEADKGIGASLRDCVQQLPDCPAFMIVLADLIDLNVADLRCVLTARSANPDNLIWRGVTEEGLPGHPVIFDQQLKPAFNNLNGDRGAETIIRSYAERTHYIPLPGQHARHDLNTPEDWAAWRSQNG